MLVFNGSIALGFRFPSTSMLQDIEKSFQSIEALPLFHKYVAIALNNIVLALLLAAASIAVLPGLALLAYNGYIIGALARVWVESGQPVEGFLISILPHGIFELTAMLYASSIGLSLAATYLSGGLSRDSLRRALASLAIVVYLLLIAAAVEVTLTPYLASHYG
ncbi:hypothetical protein CF15_06160 [Pyrodictium occultum]|uniref:Stage II sporulation protein M n=1 Tax=Pyrodictium occultum TaxID=2309 RepID=A0A0V8RWA9_PYROC|nr:hypothetical protein CF15_06160 [Pyrodictium occultum]